MLGSLGALAARHWGFSNSVRDSSSVPSHLRLFSLLACLKHMFSLKFLSIPVIESNYNIAMIASLCIIVDTVDKDKLGRNFRETSVLDSLLPLRKAQL